MSTSDDPLLPKPPAKPAGRSQRAQGLMEFALILPLLLLFVLGIIEVGRLMAIYSSVSSAAKQATRYGAVGGDSGNGMVYYLDCAGMRRTAQNTSLLQGLSNSDIRISYDKGLITQTIGLCATNAVTPTLTEDIQDGDRVVISITTTYKPIVPIVPLPSIPMTFVAAHSIFTQIIGSTPTPIPNPDLSISKVGFPLGIIPTGNTALTYTVVVTNTGVVAANTVVVTDTFPSNMNTSPLTITVGTGWAGCVTITCSSTDGGSTWRDNTGHSVSLTGCGVAGHGITCTLSTLGSFVGGNVSTPITLNVQAPISPPGIIVNTAQVGYNQSDPIPGNNTATASTFINTWVDLELHKTSLTNPVLVGNQASYGLTVKNNNWVDEPGPILLTDTLPLNTSFSSSSGTGWSPGVPNGTSVSFTYNGTLLVGGTTPTLTVILNAPDLAHQPASGLITNTATILSWDMPDPFPTNNTNITATTAVVADADLALSKTGPSITNAQVNFNYLLHVSNTGPSPATGFTLTDTVPNQFTIVSASGTNWSCTIDNTNKLVVCTYSVLLTSGATTGDITLTVQPPNANLTGVVNTAVVGFVASAETDPDLSNNSASVTTDVTTCFPGLVNASNSTVTPPTTGNVSADSSTKVLITVSLKDTCGNLIYAPPYHPQQVTLTSSRGGQDTVTVDPSTSNPSGILGFVTFDVGSMDSTTNSGISTYTAVAKDTVTNATVAIAQTAQVTYVYNCVSIVYPVNPSPGKALKFTVTNNSGTARSLTGLTLTWTSNSHLTDVKMNGTEVFNPPGNTGSPFTISSGWINTASLQLAQNASGTLELDFNNLGGTYTLSSTTWDDQHGAYKCTTPSISVSP